MKLNKQGRDKTTFQFAARCGESALAAVVRRLSCGRFAVGKKVSIKVNRLAYASQ